MADEATATAEKGTDKNVSDGPSAEAKSIADEAKKDEGARVESGVKSPAELEEIVAKADNPDAVRRALTAERQAAKAAREEAQELAQKVKEYQDKDKTEQQKLEEKANTAETRATAAEATLLRYKVAVAKKLPLDLAERLQGDTEKKLEEDADRLLDLVKPNGKPAGDVDAGKGEGGGGTSFNDMLRSR